MRTFCYLLIVASIIISCKTKDHADHDLLATVTYTCPMHPQIVEEKPGQCPICGMDLVRVDKKHDPNYGVMLSEEQLRLGNIKTMRAHYQDVKSTTVLNGQLALDEDQTEIISSRAKGRMDKLYIKEIGQSVKKGQPLYALYSEELNVLQQEYLLALQQYDEFGTARYSDLLRIAGKKLLLLGMTKNQLDRIALTKSVDTRLVFMATASGIISAIEVREGQYVEEGDALYKIENIDNLWVKAELYSNETHTVYVGDTVTVEISGLENNTVAARVAFINPEFNSRTQILVLRAEINNRKHQFYPGMQARILLSDAEKKVISLPGEAVIRDGNGANVWVLNADGSFTPRKILTGLENDDNVEIRYGIDENENVVISGAYLVYSEYVIKKGTFNTSGSVHKQ